MYNFEGLIVGVSSFLIIGIFHPIVIKGEYFFGKKIWPVFLIFGILLSLISLHVQNLPFSAILSVMGFSCFWSIHELFEQVERVKKGWFPKNPNRKYDD